MHVQPPSGLTTSIADRARVWLARGLLLSATMRVLFTPIDSMGQALGYHRERHTVLAGNLANLDTAGFVPSDLVRTTPSEVEAPSPVVMARTSAGHLAPEVEAAPPGTEIVQDELPASPDGNGVSLERELAKVEANRLRYQATSELVNKRLALLRYTAGDGV
jgi:flagellar basal-body rod protein FlgB